MQKIISTTKLLLVFAVLAMIAVGAVATPTRAAEEAAPAPCPKSTSASCAYDPDTNWSYRVPNPELE